MEKKCKNCLSFARHQGEITGNCNNKMIREGSIGDNEALVLYGGNDGDGDYLHVNCEFGCILFDNKKQDKPEMKPVVSSNIEAVGYSDTSKELHVKYKGNEAIYIYKDVPRDAYEKMTTSDSVGKFIHKEIKGKFIFDKQ